MTPRVLAEHYDAVTVVGALGEGQVPSTVLPELLRVTKPGKGGPCPLPPRPPGWWDEDTGLRGMWVPRWTLDPWHSWDTALSLLPKDGRWHGVPDPAHCQVRAAGQGRRWQ